MNGAKREKWSSWPRYLTIQKHNVRRLLNCQGTGHVIYVRSLSNLDNSFIYL
jgi:hypothetical protein